MHSFLLKIYNAILRYSNTKVAGYVLAVVAFVESSFFIFPPDILLIPMALAQPRKAWWFAFIAGLFSVLGGIFGYVIGYYFYEYIGTFIINYFHYEKQIKSLHQLYNNYDSLVILIAGFSPIPYKIITLFSGFIKANIFTFISMSIISRFGRFMLIAGIIYFGGEKAKNIIEKHIGKITIIFAIVLLVGFYTLYLVNK